MTGYRAGRSTNVHWKALWRNDYLFDEIGSALKIKQYQAEKRELLESLELYYKVKVLGSPADELLDDEQMERYQED